MIDTAAIRERCEKATPGPWTTYCNGVAGPDQRGYSDAIASYTRAVDADFIAHARTDVTALLAAHDRMREALRLAAVRLEICAARMRGCNDEGGTHELIDEVDDFAKEARAALSQQPGGASTGGEG